MVNLHLGLVEVGKFLGALFGYKPDESNDTMRQLLASRIEQLEEQRRLAEESVSEAHKLRERSREAEAAAKCLEQAGFAMSKELEEQRRLFDEAEAKADEREREAQAREAAFREAEAAAKRREEAALAKAADASAALVRGIRPIVMPTLAQVQAAKARIQYDAEKLHFAVCGASGSGKSSLINAFRGLGKGADGVAAVGVTECTSEVTRYPDPRRELPFSRFVWFDIPGAGTTAVPDWQYFNDQGLYVFDFIVMVYDVRFTKIDVGIIENCYRFNIPVLIVRSKADQHVRNMMNDEEIYSNDVDYEKVYQEVKMKYVEDTRSDFDNHMEGMAKGPDVDDRDRQMILSQRVYIVSSAIVRKLLQSGGKEAGLGVDGKKMIDELLLLDDMLRVAARRRYSKPEEQGRSKRGKDTVTAIFNSALRLK